MPKSRATRRCSSTTSTSASPSGAAEGLVVRKLRDADRMSFAGIESGIRDFATKAKDGTLTLDDPRGGDVQHHERRRVRLADEHADSESAAGWHPGPARDQRTSIAVNGQVVLRPMMHHRLTADHRIVDGSEAVRFLVRVKSWSKIRHSCSWNLTRAPAAFALASALALTGACVDRLPGTGSSHSGGDRDHEDPAEDLYKEFQADPKRAHDSFWGKAIEVSGSISNPADAKPNVPPNFLAARRTEVVAAKLLDDQAAAILADVKARPRFA